jgi:hypothetical protein
MEKFEEGVQPENDLDEKDFDPWRRLRVKALILLLCLVIPSILAIIELTTGWVGQTLQPIIPYLHRVFAF